jgi:DNA-directed RNA polymerase beta' subunit
MMREGGRAKASCSATWRDRACAAREGHPPAHQDQIPLGRHRRDGKPVTRWYDTTAGPRHARPVLPKSPKMPFDVINKLMTKKEISGVIDTVYRHCGQKETVIFCDRIMALGFHNAFKAGISFGKDDMVVPRLEVADRREPARSRRSSSSNTTTA